MLPKSESEPLRTCQVAHSKGTEKGGLKSCADALPGKGRAFKPRMIWKLCITVDLRMVLHIVNNNVHGLQAYVAHEMRDQRRSHKNT